MAHGHQGDAALTRDGAPVDGAGPSGDAGGRPWPAAVPLVLASASPRRTELLTAAGLAHQVCPADVDEAARPGEGPDALVERLARDKALAVATSRDDGTVLGGDTLVVLGERVLGKPADRDEARAMLLDLSGQEHRVLSGVALVDVASGRVVAGVDDTRVAVDALDEATLQAYLDDGEWRGKAGAYAIQGLAGRFARVVAGHWDTVVGLPVALVRRLADELADGQGETRP